MKGDFTMLLATSPTKSGILTSIERFYCGREIELIERGQIRRVSDGKILESVYVAKKGQPLPIQNP